VSILISELRRITLLWEELWLGTLAQYSGEVQRRVNRFQQEADRLSLNTSLSPQEKNKLLKDKYSIGKQNAIRSY
jgi:PI-3-kinase-related kinase SMG-1